MIFGSSSALAHDAEELEHARNLVDSAQYDEAAKRFEKLLDPKGEPCPNVATVSQEGCRLTDPAARVRARSYHGLALALSNREQEARAVFRQLLIENPTFSPSPAIFPQKVIELFLRTKEDLEIEETIQALDASKRREELRRAQASYADYVKSVEQLAATETIVERRSRWVAAIPFGVGQFHNDDVGLGVMFASVEGALLTATIVTGALHAYRVGCGVDYVDPSCQTEAGAVQPGSELSTELRALEVANWVSLGALGAAVVAGVVESQVSFKPDVIEKRSRALPPKPPTPKLEVSGGPAPVGAGLKLHF